MRIYISGPLFSEAERAWLDNLAVRLRAEGFDCFVPHENSIELNDPTPGEVFRVDAAGVRNANVLLAWLDGPVVDDGTACEIGLFAELVAGGDPRYRGIVGLVTDLRLQQRRGNTVGDGMNLFVIGAIEASGRVCWSVDEAVDALRELAAAGTRRPLDRARGAEVAKSLRAFGVKGGPLIKAAELGYITELRCAMPRCFCPEELGGAGWFAPRSRTWDDWEPTHEHFPIPKRDGGKATPDNTILAHRICNKLDYSIFDGQPIGKLLARIEAARVAAAAANLPQSAPAAEAVAEVSPTEHASPAKSSRKRKPPAWKSLPPTELAAHLLATPTIADPNWTTEKRLPRENRESFIRRILLGKTPESTSEETASLVVGDAIRRSGQRLRRVFRLSHPDCRFGGRRERQGSVGDIEEIPQNRGRELQRPPRRLHIDVGCARSHRLKDSDRVLVVRAYRIRHTLVGHVRKPEAPP